MAIARVSSTSADVGFAASITFGAFDAGSAAGRTVFGFWTNDSTAEHLTSSTYNGVSCTLGTEEVFSSTCLSNVSRLIGDANIATGTHNFVGNYTDGSHHPGGIVVSYSGVSAISIVAQGHGDTGGTPAGPITLTGTGFNSGDLAVMLMSFHAGASTTYTDSHGTTFRSVGATTFRYIGIELTASGSSVTIDGTPSVRAAWTGYMFRLQPLASGTVRRRTLGQRIGSRQGGFVRLASGLLAPRRFASNESSFLEAA